MIYGERGSVDRDDHRRRLCTENDSDGVIEHVAEQVREIGRHGTLDDRPWDSAGGYWQMIYRELATTAAESLRSSPLVVSQFQIR